MFAEGWRNGDYYYSVTIPSLIVATYGGGTGLATQRECLEMLGCYGDGNVRKLAEIVAATVLCGELSLGPRSWRRSGSRRTICWGGTGRRDGPPRTAAIRGQRWAAASSAEHFSTP